MALSRIYKQKRNMKNLHIPFLSRYFQNISLFRQSEKKKPHIVRQHDMGRYACPCERGFSAVINLFHPYCTMFRRILQEKEKCPHSVGALCGRTLILRTGIFSVSRTENNANKPFFLILCIVRVLRI